MKIINIAYVVIILAFLIGWILNIIALANSDFTAPYKQEVIRGIGVIVAPVGAVAGYITIED